MIETTADRRQGWTGVLLLLAQLAVGVVLPLAHGAGAPGENGVHVEAAGDAGCHSEAVCAVCRLADTRLHRPAHPAGPDGLLPSLATVSFPTGSGRPGQPYFPAAPVRGPPA